MSGPLIYRRTLGGAAAFDPISLSPALWLDASTNDYLYDATSGGSNVAADGPVARFEDRSGNTLHSTQGTLGARPTYKTGIKNGLSVIRFDGGDRLSGSGLSLTQQHSFMLIAADISSVGSGRIIDAGQSSNRCFVNIRTGGTYMWASSVSAITTATILSGSFILLAGVFNGNNSRGWYNGGNAVTGLNPGTNAWQNYILGGDFSAARLNGDVGEILLFDYGLSDDQIDDLRNYLNDKWSIY